MDNKPPLEDNVPPLEVRGQHLLVIRLSAMGDVAMTVPVLLALTCAYPELKIIFLTKDFFRPIIEQIPNVSVFPADVKGRHKGLLGLWRLYKELKTLEIDAVADLHHVLRSTILKLFFSFSGIPYQQIDKGRAEKKALTTAVNKTFIQLTTTHKRYADVFKKLNLSVQLSSGNTLPKLNLEDKFNGLSIKKEKILIGIAPFAAFEGKMYPLELMEMVVASLNASNTYQMVLFGGGKEEQMQLAVWENKFENCTSLVGKVSFSEELAVISNLSLMLAMDSGNAHLAAMYGVPTVTLWGVTHPFAGFYPYGQAAENALLSDRKKYPLIPTSVYGNKFPKGYEKAMETISPEKVVQKIEEILNKI
ncbi:glycosyltransferase family 9 protein [Maribacter sp. 2210JD10-5]|uniref:glycosyltransferase family 9 protein n=1 Tax=Maribacter sp. 2210JD10-5 TaxID=3386272 RepID=UPI0039BC9493